MTSRIGGVLLVLIVAGSGMGVAPAEAQDVDPSSPTVEALAQDLTRARRAHLWRVAAWGGVNLAGGLALALTTDRSRHESRWAFGAMSAGWGAVNVGIAAIGLATAPTDPATGFDAALSAERTYHDILLLNLGLNVAYAGVGGVMVAAGGRGVDDADAWRGYGSSLILQGAGLLVLDGIAFFGSRTRLADLIGKVGEVSAAVTPTGVHLAFTF